MIRDLERIAARLLAVRCVHVPERSDTKAMEVDALLTQANHILAEAINRLAENDR
jgi:hypothetical protein